MGSVPLYTRTGNASCPLAPCEAICLGVCHTIVIIFAVVMVEFCVPWKSPHWWVTKRENTYHHVTWASGRSSGNLPKDKKCRNIIVMSYMSPYSLCNSILDGMGCWKSRWWKQPIQGWKLLDLEAEKSCLIWQGQRDWHEKTKLSWLQAGNWNWIP